jgi:transposase
MKVRQSIPAELRYTIRQFDAEFPTDDACLEHIKEQRWPDGVTLCAKCNKQRKHYRVKGRTAYACDHCGNHIYPLVGTIFQKSTTPLRLWFHAMYLMGSTRCGISAKQIQRETGVTYKTAWRMFRQIRTLMTDDDVKLEGPSVECDETYFGGHRKGAPTGRWTDNKHKTSIVGVVQRGGRVVARVTKDVKRDTLFAIIKEHVLPESTVFTDDFPAYIGLEARGYTHHRINHSAKVYVMGNVHTQTIEGFWSLIKRGIGGVYHAVSQKYLQSYLNEYSFRYNRRHQGNLIFTSILQKACCRASQSPVAIVSETHPV